MKAAVLKEPNVIECQDVACPHPNDGEVLVKVAYCGICGSDIPRVFAGTSKAYPNILGHEFSGTIKSVDKDVDTALIGKRIAGIPLIPCMNCEDCQAGNYSLCKSYDFIGSRRFGAFAEYVCVPASNVCVLDETTDFLQEAFFESATVAIHGINISDFNEGATACVIGAGTIGVMVAAVLKSRGASKVLVVDIDDERLDVARQFSADFTVNSSFNAIEDILNNCDAAGGFDFVYDTSGSANAMVQTAKYAGNKGCVTFIGTPKTTMNFEVNNWEQLNRKELTLKGSWMSYSSPFPGSEWAEANELFSNGTLKIADGFIDKIYKLDEATAAFGRFKDPRDIHGKIIFDCSE